VSRGILSTMYVRVPGGPPPLAALFARAYEGEPFIVLRGEDAPPELREVRGTNRCAIGWRWDAPTGQAIVVTAIDNLGKGAAGQAVQCLNLMLGLDETAGLEAPALVP
jgi:N-acetyl-gamma-glutamyl-phosphate reductase